MATFASSFSFQITTVFNSLEDTAAKCCLELTDELDNPSKVYFQVDRDDLYKFQVANAELDGFIKLLLRSYTGLFTNYVSIDEQLMAQRANISAELVYQFLTRLENTEDNRLYSSEKDPPILFLQKKGLISTASG